MSDTRAESALSGVELVVLACLSQKARTPSDDELGSAVRDLCFPDEAPERTRRMAVDALDVLRQRGLVEARGKMLSDRGGRALRAVFGLTRRPSWDAFRDRHLPALALGLQGSSSTAMLVKNETATAAAVVSRELGVGKGVTLGTLCDTLIADALGMPPGEITLERIRAHVLARRAGVEAKGTSAELAASIAAKAVGAESGDRAALAIALGRRWLRGRDSAAEPSHNDHARNGEVARQVSATLAVEASHMSSTPSPALMTTERKPQPPPHDLLEVVRETLPQIGAEGRFGSEKVFVSALWHRIEHRARPSELSLDRFKRWLLTANRDGSLILARADLIGAMDARQVQESEIQDRGATFHFVLDSQTDQSAQGGSHVR